MPKSFKSSSATPTSLFISRSKPEEEAANQLNQSVNQTETKEPA